MNVKGKRRGERKVSGGRPVMVGAQVPEDWLEFFKRRRQRTGIPIWIAMVEAFEASWGGEPDAPAPRNSD